METKTTKAQQKAVQKYVKNNYDKILVTVPKGDRDIIKAYAESQGVSVNGFIQQAISEQMRRIDEKG